MGETACSVDTPSKLPFVPIGERTSKGIPAHRCERIEAAVLAGGWRAFGSHEAWIAAGVFKGGVNGQNTRSL
jgi:hypothetical protein